MSCCLPPFRISAKILCRNNRKRPYDKEQAILLLSANKNCQLTDDRILLTEKTFTLIFRVITIADLSLSLCMTSYCPSHHDSRSFNHALDDDFPSAVILNGGKNTLWENQETER